MSGTLDLSAVRSSKAVRYGSMPLFALAMTQALQQGEQVSLSQALEGIRLEFGTSDFVLGLLPLAMAFSGILATIPLGTLTDRRRRTTLVAGSMVLWSAAMGVAGLSVSLLMLFVLRMGLGGVEASGVASISLLADYYPVDKRAQKIGLFSGGSLLGVLIAFPVGGVLVDRFGWRSVFFLWVPLGLFVAWLIARQPEPRRGDQDHDFGIDAGVLGGGAATEAGRSLPEPRRIGTMDYASANLRQVFGEVWRIRSLWYATAALTAANLVTNALQFWGIAYFTRVHDLSTAKASALAGLLGFGSLLGILLGGLICDRLMARGFINARAYVAAAGGLLGTVLLTPAWAIVDLRVTAPLFFFGGLCLTLPIPATEAILADVVVAELRGRAVTIRSFARIVANAGPFAVGALATVLGDGTEGDGLRLGLTYFTPIFALSTVAMLLCVRHYAHDLAFVCAESERLRAQAPVSSPPGPPGPPA